MICFDLGGLWPHLLAAGDKRRCIRLLSADAFMDADPLLGGEKKHKFGDF